MVTEAVEGSILYGFPYPIMTHPWTDTPCGAALEAGAGCYLCTKERGHDGRHEASGSTGEIYASWPRPRASVTFSDGAPE